MAQDDLLASNTSAAADDSAAGSPPLAQLRTSLHTAWNTGAPVEPAVQACVGQLFQHARVTRSHVLETVLQEALRAAGEQDMHEAEDVSSQRAGLCGPWVVRGKPTSLKDEREIFKRLLVMPEEQHAGLLVPPLS